MIRCSVFIAASLDGFIARENGDVDWLSGFDGAEAGEDYGYRAFMETVDALVMGRGTHDTVRTFGAWPYGETPVVVLTSRPVDLPAGAPVEAMAGAPAEIVERLAARGARHLYVDGGKTIQAFLEAGLIQRLILTRIPMLIGTGIPLFGPLSRDVRLRHVETRTFDSGLVQSTYHVLGA